MWATPTLCAARWTAQRSPTISCIRCRQARILPRAIGATRRCFAEAARAVGVRHVIYLGGLLPKGGAPSLHLSSRAEVGQILRESDPMY
jgi:ribosomal protein S14